MDNVWFWNENLYQCRIQGAVWGNFPSNVWGDNRVWVKAPSTGASFWCLSSKIRDKKYSQTKKCFTLRRTSEFTCRAFTLKLYYRIVLKLLFFRNNNTVPLLFPRECCPVVLRLGQGWANSGPQIAVGKYTLPEASRKIFKSELSSNSSQQTLVLS